jgi:hypothetical protein
MIGCLDTYFGILKYTKDHKATALFNYILSRSEDGTGDWGYCILFEKDIIETCYLKEYEIHKLVMKLKNKYELLNFNYELSVSGNDRIEFIINKNIYYKLMTGDL